jgi:DNA (cytosine-5)-methyltransferase 1
MSTRQAFTFADLFAGIGGMRLAFESVGGECTLTSEINEHALKTYKFQNWKSDHPDHKFVDDVVELGDLSASKIPKHDVLVAGFPCQPYSIAGLRQGLEDEKGRGQVFLSILDVLKKAKPKAFLLENVKGMMSHDQGRTLAYMLERLALQTGPNKKPLYTVLQPQVMNSMTHGGVPQNRERVFIIGFRNDVDYSSFQFPEPIKLKATLQTKLQKKDVAEKYFYDKRFECFTEIKKAVVRDDTAYQWRRVYVRENKSGVCPALTANMGSGGHNVPLVKVEGGIRKLTPRECANLQGFDLFDFKIPSEMADAHLYHQFGNSVTVPLIARIAEKIAEVVTID